MANRYYRPSHTRSKSRKRSARRSTTWLWVLFGMFMGVGGSAVSYLWLSDQKPASARFSQIKSSVRKAAKKEKESTQRFEFYTLLPGMEIQLPDANSTPATKALEKPAAGSVQVIVQPQASPPPSPPSPPMTQNAAVLKPQSLPAKPTAVPSSNLTTAQYIVQAGIFQTLEQADALKAQLTLQGFNTKIQKVQTQEGHTWFRVTLGPFTSESSALNQKKRLEGQKIHGTLILQRPNS